MARKRRDNFICSEYQKERDELIKKVIEKVLEDRWIERVRPCLLKDSLYNSQLERYLKIKVGAKVKFSRENNIYIVSSICKEATHFHVKKRNGEWHMMCGGFEVIE